TEIRPASVLLTRYKYCQKAASDGNPAAGSSDSADVLREVDEENCCWWVMELRAAPCPRLMLKKAGWCFARDDGLIY
ncbi:hypothetical protein X777_05202, partial [Ooceraea biroi]